MKRTAARRHRSTAKMTPLLAALLGLLLVACAVPAATTTPASESESAPATDAEVTAPDAAPALVEGVDLAGIKDYAVTQGEAMQSATADLATTVQQYYDLVEEARATAPNDPYAALWAAQPELATELIATAKDQWLEASTHYELNEGIVAGVPSLAYYDLWIDAGPPATESPEEALDWQLELPNGDVLESPGNFFHNLLEPALWGTHPDYTGLLVDLNEDGEASVGEALPNADILLASAQGLDAATSEMNAAIADWEPTLDDAFTALVTMIPTMNEYFEQWKESAFVSGEASEAESFIAVSRLFDVHGILNGLSVTYDSIAPQIEASDAELHAQIRADFDRLIAYVDDLYSQEQNGMRFNAEEADLFGSEAQDLATALAALVAQAATELELDVELS